MTETRGRWVHADQEEGPNTRVLNNRVPPRWVRTCNGTGDGTRPARSREPDRDRPAPGFLMPVVAAF